MRTLYNVDQAANALGLSARTLSRMRLEGHGPQFIKLGGRVLYDPADLEKWVNANRYGSTSEYAESQSVSAHSSSLSPLQQRTVAGSSRPKREAGYDE